MELTRAPDTLRCIVCDTTVGSGYLPAVETDDGHEPLPDDAVCDACGFTAVGMNGCAPELDDVTDDPRADTLLHVRVTDDGIEVLGSK